MWSNMDMDSIANSSTAFLLEKIINLFTYYTYLERLY